MSIHYTVRKNGSYYESVCPVRDCRVSIASNKLPQVESDIAVHAQRKHNDTANISSPRD